MKKKSKSKRILKHWHVLFALCFSFSLFSFSEKVHAEGVLGTWNVTPEGIITAMSPGTGGSYEFMKSDPTGGVNGGVACGNSASGTGGIDSADFVGENIATRMGAGCTAPGTYYFIIGNGFPFNTTLYYWEIYYDGTNFVGPVDNTLTRIELISPENNATTTSTTIELEVQYYINSDTHGNIEELTLEYFVSNPILISGTTAYGFEIENIVFDELISTSTTIELVNNQVYKWNARLNAGISDPLCAQGSLSIIFCAFQNLQNKIIARSPQWLFTIGTDPRTSITDFGNSLFDATGGDSNLLGGGCAFVATSTCEITSPSTYGGCFTNSMIIALCPSANTISYATSTLMNSFYNKMPFGFFVQPYQKISEITNSSSTIAGSDIVVDIGSVGGTTTIFSWSEAKAFMDSAIGEGTVALLMVVEWIIFSFWAFYLVMYSGKKKDQ